MKMQSWPTFKVLLYMIIVYTLATILGLFVLFNLIKAVAYFREGVTMDFDTRTLFKAIKLGIPLGVFWGLGHWFFYKLNIR